LGETNLSALTRLNAWSYMIDLNKRRVSNERKVWSVGQSIGMLVGRSIDLSVGRSVGRWVRRSVGPSAGRSVGRVGWRSGDVVEG
jgi:hypothetical protein